MKYMGSKSRIAKEIVPIISEYIAYDKEYVEPFCGGCNLIDKIQHPFKWANDSHNYLISCFKELQNGWIPPINITELEYNNIKNNKELYPDYLVGYVGFNSYAGKWFGGYRRDKEQKRDYWKEHYIHMMRQIKNLKGVKFTCHNYWELQLNNCVVYCDPPYANTTKYKSTFNSDLFWKWISKIKENNIVFVSEYNAPEEYSYVWSRQVNNTLVANTGSKKGIEKLFFCK